MDLSHVRFHGTPAKRALARPCRRQPDAVTVDSCRKAVADRAVSGLAALVLARAGLDPAAYRPDPLERRLGACLRALKVNAEAPGSARVLAESQACADALNALLLGVSEFFRDDVVFDSIARVVTPALARRSGPIRVCSIGCSNGAELYSVAILLAEAGLLQRASMIGVDCRADALSAARAAVFPDEAMRTVPDGLRARYFEQTHEGWRVVDRVQEAATWRLADATCEIPEGPWDLILCRNLLMYLRPAAADAMMRAAVARLSPAGFLVVGKAERPPTDLRLASVSRCLYRVRADA